MECNKVGNKNYRVRHVLLCFSYMVKPVNVSLSARHEKHSMPYNNYCYSLITLKRFLPKLVALKPECNVCH